MWHLRNQGFKQMGSVYGIFEGTQKSGEKSLYISEMQNRFRSVQIGKSIYSDLYRNRWDLVNQNRRLRQLVIY